MVDTRLPCELPIPKIDDTSASSRLKSATHLLPGFFFLLPVHNWRTICGLLLLIPALAACGSTPLSHRSVPEALVAGAEVLNFEAARTWADDFSPGYLDLIRKQENRKLESGLASREASVLVLSGGGQNGAFGAGYLNGWSARGTRPEFEVVTGVSTGALIAPLAFLGQKYDDDLKRFYTTHSTRDIVRPNYIAGLLGGAAVTDSKPLADLIADFVTEDFLAEVARENRRGRILAVVTTNIEAQRPVVWNMGQIAEVGTPEALTLFRSVMLASASIPGAFPPVRIDVTANGESYSELHVDGATSTNVFLAPFNLSFSQSTNNRKGRFYILTNGKYLPEYKPMEARTIAIASRAISTMVKYITKADVQRLRLFARQHGAEMRFISIPNSFEAESSEPFDQSYMNELYEYGYGAGQTGQLETSEPRVF